MMSKKSPLEFIENSAPNTPDFLDLKYRKRRLFPIFIYASLQVGTRHFEKLLGRDAIYYGRARTLPRTFFSKIGVGSSEINDPVVFNAYTKNVPYIGNVEGDVFAVGLRQIAFLDYLYDNGNMFDRRNYFVKLTQQPSLPDNQCYVSCMMWLGDQDKFEECYGSLDQCKFAPSYVKHGETTYLY